MNTHHLFVLLIIFFAWLPLPRGSTFDWSWLLAIAWSSVMLIVWLDLYRRARAEVTPAFIQARWVLVLLLAWLGWLCMQTIPLPLGVLEALAPLSADLWMNIDPMPSRGTISVDVAATREEILKTTSYLITFALILLLVDSPKRLQQFAVSLVIITVLQAVMASLLYLADIDIYYRSFSAQGTFANRNQLAGFLQLNLAVGIGLMLAGMQEHRSRSWRERVRGLAQALLSRKVRLRIYLAVMVITLVLTHSRMGNTAFFVSMTIAGLLALLLMKRSPRPLVLLLGSLIIIDILILSQWFGLDRLQERFQEIQTEQVSMDGGTVTINRLNTTRQANLLREASAPAGTGAGTFFSVFPVFQDASQPGFYQHAHNDYLEFLTDSGWPGFLLLGLVVMMSLYTAIMAMRRRRHPLMRGMAFAAVMGILSLLIHSTTDFNLRIPSNAMLFMVVLALAWIAAYLPIERTRQ